jgi:hypothetical protein
MDRLLNHYLSERNPGMNETLYEPGTKIRLVEASDQLPKSKIGYVFTKYTNRIFIVGLDNYYPGG